MELMGHPNPDHLCEQWGVPLSAILIVCVCVCEQ